MPILIRVHTPEAFQNYTVRNDLNHLRVFENPHKLPWSAFIGVLGMPGKLLGVALVFMSYLGNLFFF